MSIFRRKRTVKLYDERKAYYLPARGCLPTQPNLERASEVFWGAVNQYAYDDDQPWDGLPNNIRDQVRTGMAAVLHWVEQQEKE